MVRTTRFDLRNEDIGFAISKLTVNIMEINLGIQLALAQFCVVVVDFTEFLGELGKLSEQAKQSTSIQVAQFQR